MTTEPTLLTDAQAAQHCGVDLETWLEFQDTLFPAAPAADTEERTV